MKNLPKVSCCSAVFRSFPNQFQHGSSCRGSASIVVQILRSAGIRWPCPLLFRVLLYWLCCMSHVGACIDELARSIEWSSALAANHWQCLVFSVKEAFAAGIPTSPFEIRLAAALSPGQTQL